MPLLTSCCVVNSLLCIIQFLYVPHCTFVCNLVMLRQLRKNSYTYHHEVKLIIKSNVSVLNTNFCCRTVFDMGILGLSKLLADFAPSSIKDNSIKSYFGQCSISTALLTINSGRKVAIDASMSIYQFLIAVRSEGAQLTDAEGETTR